MRCVRPELRTSSLPIPTYLSPSPSSSSSQAATFPIGAYTYKEVQTAFAAVRAHWPDAEVRVALYNAGYGVRKPFLEITEAEVAELVAPEDGHARGVAQRVGREVGGVRVLGLDLPRDHALTPGRRGRAVVGVVAVV